MGEIGFCICNTCSENEGDCDFHNECQDGLFCGSNNCPAYLGFDSEFDCCYQPTKTYYFDQSIGIKTFEEAKIFCNSLGKKLSEPKSSQTNIAVTELLQNEGVSSFWIGIHDKANEGNFVYETNSQTIGYQNWNPGEPNDWGPGEDCTEIHVGNGKWNDMPCSEQLSVVCENPGKSRIDCDSKC